MHLMSFWQFFRGYLKRYGGNGDPRGKPRKKANQSFLCDGIDDGSVSFPRLPGFLVLVFNLLPRTRFNDWKSCADDVLT